MLELYGSRMCPFTAELRERLEWEGRSFVEYDVDADDGALQRLVALRGGDRAIPVLVEDGTVQRVGWEGRTCYASMR